jgi:hypothetical protein
VGGSGAVEWAETLEATFEAGLAREEEIAASDLAFSLRQDVDLQAAVARSGAGWNLLAPGGATAAVDDVGVDYVRAATLLVRASHAVLRSTDGPKPRVVDRRLLELLGEACRSGVEASVTTGNGTTAGRLIRVANDHLALRNEDSEMVVGLGAVESVRLLGYSASRGFSG